MINFSFKLARGWLLSPQFMPSHITIPLCYELNYDSDSRIHVRWTRRHIFLIPQTEMGRISIIESTYPSVHFCSNDCNLFNSYPLFAFHGLKFIKKLSPLWFWAYFSTV